MVAIPPGRFKMGSPSSEHGSVVEGPVHAVEIRYDFSVSKYPITRGEWKQFVQQTGHKDGSCLKGKPDNHPVVCVSWQDAQDYAVWLSGKSGQHYRLLTEAEYEYVNRAGSQAMYFWGDSDQELPQYANKSGAVTSVGSFKPNAFGLFDTTGNAWSWTADCWHDSYNGAPTDGSAWLRRGDCSRRVVRGGSSVNDSWRLRSAYRSFWRHDFGQVGFRVASTSS